MSSNKIKASTATSSDITDGEYDRMMIMCVAFRFVFNWVTLEVKDVERSRTDGLHTGL